MPQLSPTGGGEHAIEIGIIGREGMTGLSVVLETDRSPHDVFIQLAGYGQRISAENMRQVLTESMTLRRSLTHFVHAFLVQTGYTAMANGRSRLEERLARWLLMAHDRVDSDELALTHEFLAMMLGVRRPGVTVALNLLEQKGLIATDRGVVTILDREGLEQNSNGAYGQAEAEFKRLFG